MLVSRWVIETEFDCIDANFRLRCRDRKLHDPPFTDGLAYYVKKAVYKAYTDGVMAQTEVRFNYTRRGTFLH